MLHLRLFAQVLALFVSGKQTRFFALLQVSNEIKSIMQHNSLFVLKFIFWITFPFLGHVGMFLLYIQKGHFQIGKSGQATFNPLIYKMNTNICDQRFYPIHIHT